MEADIVALMADDSGSAGGGIGNGGAIVCKGSTLDKTATNYSMYCTVLCHAAEGEV